MHPATALPDNVARLRKARNLSQEELAEVAGVGVDTVGRVERGERHTVRPQTLARLARALGVEPAVLLGSAHGVATTDDHAGAADVLRRAISASGDIPGLSGHAESEELPTLNALVAAGRQA